MTYIPKVGDKVRLNTAGLAAVRLSTQAEIDAQTNGSTVTGVEPIPCDDFDLWGVDVDGPFSTHLLTNMWVEPINPPHKHQWWSSTGGSFGGGAWRCDCGATQPRTIGPGV